MTDEAKATCKATTKVGRPCRKQAVERGFCLFHSGKLDLAEQGRRGGKASGEARSRKQQPEQPGDRLEGLAHTALEELLASSGNATARAAAARLVIDKMAAHSPLNAELARRAAYEAIQQQMQSQMPAVREKLTVLIERRAQTLARKMYRKRMKLETEAVKAEMTTGASTESEGEDASTQERAEEASAVLDEAARLWVASGLVPVDVDERTVLRGLFELGLIAPGHKWQAQAEEEPQPPPTRPRHRHLLPSTLRPCSRTPVSKPSASASPASSTCRQSRDPGRGNRRHPRPRLPAFPRRPLRIAGAG